MSTTHELVSWTDQLRQHRGRRPTTGAYGTATSEQAAIRLAERVLPRDAEYVVATGSID